MRKRYRAMALGTVDASIECIESDVEGRRAKTLVKVVEVTPHVQAGSLTTLDLWPVTGRRHQLRRHLAELGHPLLGDDLYFEAEGSGREQTALAEGRTAGSDASFYGKKSEGLFLMSCECSVPFDGRVVHAEMPEARKFERQRQRARLGWLHSAQGVGT